MCEGENTVSEYSTQMSKAKEHDVKSSVRADSRRNVKGFENPNPNPKSKDHSNPHIADRREIATPSKQ
jgi:hypothetical protein